MLFYYSKSRVYFFRKEIETACVLKQSIKKAVQDSMQDISQSVRHTHSLSERVNNKEKEFMESSLSSCYLLPSSRPPSHSSFLLVSNISSSFYTSFVTLSSTGPRKEMEIDFKR